MRVTKEEFRDWLLGVQAARRKAKSMVAKAKHMDVLQYEFDRADRIRKNKGRQTTTQKRAWR